MKKEKRLYNVVFPLWMMFLLPTWIWLIILPANFAIDSLALLLAAAHCKLENKLALWKKSILKIWLIGFACDFVGAGLSLGLLFLSGLFDIDIGKTGMILLAIPAVILAGVLIYFVNKWLSFRKTGLDAATVRKICLVLAIFTAPYTMLIPMFI